MRQPEIADIQDPIVEAEDMSRRRIDRRAQNVGIRIVAQEVRVVEHVEEISPEFKAPVLVTWDKPERLLNREIKTSERRTHTSVPLQITIRKCEIH